MARVGCSTPFSHRAARHCACGIVAALLSTATPTLSAKTPLPAASAQTRPAAAAAQAMGNADVVRMATAGLPESVIVTAIEAAESAQFDVSANGLVALKTGGVSDATIAAMQRSANAAHATIAAPAEHSRRAAVPSGAAAAPKRVTIASGTAVKVQIVEKISSQDALVGQQVQFTAAADVVVDGETAIQRDAVAWGKITKVVPQRLVRSGTLEFTIDTIRAVDGQDITLRSVQSLAPGRGLVTGSEADVAAGAVFNAVVEREQSVALTAPAPAAAAARSVAASAPSAATAPATAAVESSDPDDPASPHEPGIYVAIEDGSAHKLVALEPNAFSQGKSGSLFATGLTYGIKKTKWNAVVRGRSATLRIRDRQPTFYFFFEKTTSGLSNTAFFSGASSPNEFILAKMAQKSGERQLVVGEFGALGTSSGTRSEDTVVLKAERLRPGVYRVTPSVALDVKGEYCLFHAAAARAFGAGFGKLFDFGVDLK